MTSLMMVKLRRDLRATWTRFALMVLAIAICLAAFASVLFAWAASGQETRAAYRSTEPASATLLLDQPVPVAAMQRLVDAARERPGVLDATGRTLFSGDVSVNGRPREFPLQVFVSAADDPLTMARFFTTGDTWPPTAEQILIGADSLALLDVGVGDTVTVTTPAGREVEVVVADTVYDPSLSPSPQEQTGRGYLTTAALAADGASATLDQLKIQVADGGGDSPTLDRDRAVAVAEDVAADLQDGFGVTIREVQAPPPGEHPHQWQADSLLLSLLAGAFAALLLSSILVATMLANLFTQQIPQIGILKAIGAGSGRIGRHYLLMVLTVAAAATALAVGPAVLLSRQATGQFLGFIGVQSEGLGAPWWTWVVVLALGLALPPLMALGPLLRASRTSVRAAIDHHGGTSRPGRMAGLLTRLNRMGRLNRGFLLALRNTVRRPVRFVLAVGLLACAGTVVVAGMSVSSSVRAVSDEQAADRTWDVDVQLSQPAPVSELRSSLGGKADVERVDGILQTPAGLAGTGRMPISRTYPDQGHGRVNLTAIPDGTESFEAPTISEGRWLRPGETQALVINQLTRKNSLPGAEPGDTVQLVVDGETTSWRVVGIAQERGGHGGLYTTLAAYAEALRQPAAVNRLRVVTTSHDEQTREDVAESALTTLAADGFQVVTADSVARSDAVGSAHLEPIVLILLGVGLPLGAVGLIGLASTMSANILDRYREFGIMHAIGAQPSAVRRIVVTEGVILAVTSCLVAVPPALGVAALLEAGLGNLFFAAPLPFRFSLTAVGIWLALVTIGAALATETAAKRAARITVREALSQA